MSMSVVEPLYGPHGWRFGTARHVADSANGGSELAEIYLRADPHFSGRVTVPVLWDKERRTIVNNELAEIIRMLNWAFGRFTNVRTDYYPRRCTKRSITSTNSSTKISTTASIARDLPPPRRPMRRRSANCSRHSTRSNSGSHTSAISPGGDHRGRLAAVHDAGALRCGVLRPLQMQPAPHRRLSQPVELPARTLSEARHRRDREHGPHQAALLRHHRNVNPTGIVRSARSSISAPHDRGRFGD